MFYNALYPGHFWKAVILSFVLHGGIIILMTWSGQKSYKVEQSTLSIQAIILNKEWVDSYETPIVAHKEKQVPMSALRVNKASIIADSVSNPQQLRAQKPVETPMVVHEEKQAPTSVLRVNKTPIIADSVSHPQPLRAQKAERKKGKATAVLSNSIPQGKNSARIEKQQSEGLKMASKRGKGKPSQPKGKKVQKKHPKNVEKKPPAVNIDTLFHDLAVRRKPPIGSAIARGSIQSAQRSKGPTMQEVRDYQTQVAWVIQKQFIKEPRARGERCEFALRLTVDGVIVHAELRRGQLTLCQPAMRAIGIVGRLPKPPTAQLYELFKELIVSFEL